MVHPSTLIAALLAMLAASACDSNPTPHPQWQDTQPSHAPDATGTNNAGDPDDNTDSEGRTDDDDASVPVATASDAGTAEQDTSPSDVGAESPDAVDGETEPSGGCEEAPCDGAFGSRDGGSDDDDDPSPPPPPPTVRHKR